MAEPVYCHQSAVFSQDLVYRYTLARIWNPRLSAVNFVLCNPSTADADRLDPTLRRCVGFARAWGYGGMIITNIFALRSTDPAGLRRVDDPIGADNDAQILRAADMFSAVRGRIVCGWGVHGAYLGRGEQVRRLLRDRALWCLGTTRGGHPRHPLYLRTDTRLQCYQEGML